MSERDRAVIMFLEKKFEKIFFYNIDVILFYLVISVAYLYRVLGSHFLSRNFFLLIIANVIGVFGVYLWNRNFDVQEDRANGILGSFHQGWLTKISLVAIIAAVVTYFFVGGFFFGGAAVLLATLGILYSYPEKYRLKKLFFIKNITPAFCWTLSLASLLSISAESLSIYEAFTWLLPLFFLAVCFEVFWDLPDMEGDKRVGVHTFPTLFGFSLTRTLLFLVLLFFFLSAPTVATKSFSLLFAAALMVVSPETKKQFYHWILVLFTGFILIFHGMALWDDIQNKHTEYLKHHRLNLVEPGTELLYDYVEKNVWIDGQEKPSYSEEKLIRIEYDQDLQVYRNVHNDNSIVLDPGTFTLSEFWQSVPSYYRPHITDVQEGVSGNIFMKGSYETSPRAGSPCEHVSVFGDFDVMIDAGESYESDVIEGEKHTVTPLFIKEIGPWNHCGVRGSIWFEYIFVPELGVITEFQGTIYYGNVPGRMIEMRLRELKSIR